MYRWIKFIFSISILQTTLEDERARDNKPERRLNAEHRRIFKEDGDRYGYLLCSIKIYFNR